MWVNFSKCCEWTSVCVLLAVVCRFTNLNFQGDMAHWSYENWDWWLRKYKDLFHMEIAKSKNWAICNRSVQWTCCFYNYHNWSDYETLRDVTFGKFGLSAFHSHEIQCMNMMTSCVVLLLFECLDKNSFTSLILKQCLISLL